MTLVVGATGQLGGAIVSALTAKRQKVAALVRTPEKEESLRANGIEIKRGDLREPRSLARAVAGQDVVICSATSMARADTIREVDDCGVRDLIAAAAAANVKHFVLVSFPPMTVDSPLQEAKRNAERALKESGLKYTILQPWYFADNWVYGPPFGYDHKESRYEILGAGDQKNAWVNIVDVARLAARVAGDPHTFGKTYEFGGNEPLSQLDIMSELWRAGAKIAHVVHTSLEQLQTAYSEATDEKMKSVGALRLELANGRVLGTVPTLPLHRPYVTTVSDQLARAASSKAAAVPVTNVEDLIIAYYNTALSGVVYRHVPASVYKGLAAPKAPLAQVLTPFENASIAATIAKDAVHGVDQQTAFVNLEKLVPTYQGNTPITAASTTQQGADHLAWQVVLRQGPTAVTEDSYFYLSEKMLNACVEFPSGQLETYYLDEFVDDRGVLAWMPSQNGGITGCVCIVLNLTSLR